MGFNKGFIIRRYEGDLDRAQVEDLERRCEVGPATHVFLFTDTLGDPICRIRNSPLYKMLVAQWDNELVGVIQGSIKFVTIHKPPHYVAKLGYILGLRVAPLYRHKGIGSSLVRHLEEWFATNDVDYSCMATEKDNEASVNLFINKLRYIKFRTARILVNPVTSRPYHIPSQIEIQRLKVEEAEAMYRKYMASTEFFPKDINNILRNKLSLGTWVTYFKEEESCFAADQGKVPTNWAILSLWNSGQIFKLRLEKAPVPWLIYTKSLKLVDKIFPCFKPLLLPNFFQPFGFYFMYGLHHEGPFSGKLVRALCQYMHNMAMDSASRDDCRVIVTEIGGQDALKEDIPHWKLLSCPEDLWCIKALKSEEERSHNNYGVLEWTKTPPTKALFVDPREV